MGVIVQVCARCPGKPRGRVEHVCACMCCWDSGLSGNTRMTDDRVCVYGFVPRIWMCGGRMQGVCARVWVG